MGRNDAQQTVVDSAVNERRICLNQSVLDFMAAKITPQSFVLEFGAGWSSRWFAERCGRLVSIETSSKWADIVQRDLAGVACNWSVRPMLNPGDAMDVDLALIDGPDDSRDACARLAWPMLRSGGWLVLDDAQREMYAETVEWLNQQASDRPLQGISRPLVWSDGDVETARERIALAWQRA